MKKESTNPYVGLRPYEAEESLLFFGRAEQTLELLQRLHQHHFVAVVGSSGCGKSSLLRAGLIPALKAGYLVEDSDQWFVGIMKPGQNPLYNLAETLLQQLNPETNEAAVTELVTIIKEEGVDAILDIITSLRKNKNLNFFLLVDQFEELFRFAMEQNEFEKRDDAIDFVNIMLELSTQTLVPFYVVMTMRSDFIGDCAQYYGLPEAMNRSLYLVPKLSRQQLKKVIESPAKLFGGKLNPVLTTRLLNELGKVKDELPLLQHALMRMWDFEMDVDKNGELDLQDYENIGGIEKALSKHADEALDGMSAEDLLLTKHIFQALTAIDENGRKIRRPVLLSQLKELSGAKEEKLLDIINRFIKDKRSFLMVNKAGTSDEVIDISHESLIRQWATLRDWVDEEDGSATIYLQLNEAAKLHQESKKDFLTGSELQFALDWYNEFKPVTAWGNRYKEGFKESVQYLINSDNERSRVIYIEKSRIRRQRLLVVIVMGLILIGAIASVFVAISFREKNKDIEIALIEADSSARVANVQKIIAEEKTNEALHSKKEADSSARVANEQKLIAEEKTNEALRSKNEADSSARVANEQKLIAEEKTNEALRSKKEADSSAKVAIEEKNKAQANYLISEANKHFTDDPTLAMGLAKEAIQLYDNDIIRNDAQKIYRENSFYKIIARDYSRITSVAFSPDGKTILTGNWYEPARLWNLEGEMQQEFTGHTSAINSVAFSPDGKAILTGSGNGTARLWNLEGEMQQEFKGHTSVISSVTFSPDGKTILTGSYDKTARLWNLQGEMLQEFTDRTDIIYSVAFSPDGKTILTGSRDKTARLWNLEGKMLEEFTGHTDIIYSVAFSPDGKTVLTGSWDNTARLWNLEGEMQQEFTGHTSAINSVAFSPNARNILTGSRDKTARLWNLEGEMLLEFTVHNGAIYSVTFSPDGKTILTGSGNETACLWNLEGEMLQEFTGHDGAIYSVTFSPDGKTMLTGSRDRTARLWNLEGEMLKEFIGHTDGITSVAFSPDGKAILTGSIDNTARLWNIAGEMLKEFIGHTDLITSVAFSPDGKTILTGSYDQTARLWNLQGEMQQEFTGHDGAISSVTFSPDEKTILTGSRDETARLWDVPMPLDEFLESGWLAPLTAAQKMKYGIKE